MGAHRTRLAAVAASLDGAQVSVHWAAANAEA